jgi:type IV pilus assembly protein PilA
MRNTSHHQQGFTIIELMVVVAIVSILAVIAISAYQDYVTRAKVGEGMVFMAEAKTSVSEYYYTTRKMPVNNQQAGLSNPDDYDVFNYLSRLDVSTTPRPGTITVTFDIPNLGWGNLLQLIPSTASSSREITWTCAAPEEDGVDNSKLPANCRS